MNDTLTTSRVGPPGWASKVCDRLETLRGRQGETLGAGKPEEVELVAAGSVGGARQGHLYTWRGNKVIAMESGALPRVSYIDPSWQWCSQPFHVSADELEPEPMAYFHGEVPK